MGKGFTADAERLREGARTHLTNLVDNLTDAKRVLDATSAHDGAFRGGEGLFEDAGGRWDEARHFLGRVLADNAENLDLARQALDEIARRYEEADDAGAQAVRR